jgi:hypothetical protein
MVTGPIDNHLSRNIPHVHSDAEPEVVPDELRSHLIKYHGWALWMLRKRGGDTPEGTAYIRSWHGGAHKGIQDASGHTAVEW